MTAPGATGPHQNRFAFFSLLRRQPISGLYLYNIAGKLPDNLPCDIVQIEPTEDQSVQIWWWSVKKHQSYKYKLKR